MRVTLRALFTFTPRSLSDFGRPRRGWAADKVSLAEAMGVQRKHVNALCNDRRAITAAPSLFLARAFGASPDFWLNVQRTLWPNETSPLTCILQCSRILRMFARHPETADIDATIARGEWWSRLFDELADLGMERVDALSATRPKPLRGMVDTAIRVFRAVRLAVVAAMRLDQILAGLADLRAHSAADIAAAWARARARADEDAATRERADERAMARREAREGEVRERVNDSAEHPEPKPEPRDRDPLVEALDKRLAAVDPAIVDFDDLDLREAVLRICADLGVTPDWSRWEAGDWTARGTRPTGDANAAAATLVAAPPREPRRHPPRFLPPLVLPGLPKRAAHATDTALSHVFLAGLDISERRPPRLE